MEAIADMASDPNIQEMGQVRGLANINRRHSNDVAQEADALRQTLTAMPTEKLESLFDALPVRREWPAEGTQA